MMEFRKGGWAALALGFAAGAVLCGCLAARRRPARRRFDPEAIDYGDPVDEASNQSFPASDPPSFNAPGRLGEPREG